MKMKFKSNRMAFTLVELLIVIAIIGILFVVLVSKVDFATDKAKTTGVQTDFRSFQVAFETVSRENAGFNTLGWDTGDKADASLLTGYTYENADKDGGDRIRNSYDKGDMNLNGICEEGETWIGQKLYTETWTGIYTLDNPADATDMSAYLALEKAINKNLDPALQISIDPENKTIYMANGYQDPWTTEYHGFYLSNAAVDGKDRGAIVMYSDGPNKVFGSEQTIANGIVTVTVKNGGINGQDDLSLVTCYTYTNGYGEIGTTTFGFSNNQQMQVGGGNCGLIVTPSEPAGPGAGGYQMLVKPTAPIISDVDVEFRSEAEFNTFDYVNVNGTKLDSSNYTVAEGSIKVVLKASYIATLEDGTYELEIVSKDGGSAISEFVISTCMHASHDEDGNCTDCLNYVGHDFNEWGSCNGCDFYCEHMDQNGDYTFSNGNCVICGAECGGCEWAEVNVQSNNNGTHKYNYYCYTCGKEWETEDETCWIEDEGTCICGYELCSHEGYGAAGDYIDAEYHEYYSSCVNCGKDFSPPGNKMEHDYDGDGWCWECNEYCRHDTANRTEDYCYACNNYC